MDNRVYYGEYSLQHWIDLILKENILLPDYQRYFVWDERKVMTLIDTFRESKFVPPITIGAFKTENLNYNLILDGQQRLTSIFLAYLGLFPDKAIYKNAIIERFANDNDDEDDVEEDEFELDNILQWNFKNLTKKGKSKDEILSRVKAGNYKSINFGIDENFLKSTFLGFSYLVPRITDEKEQQKYYSSVFRHINIQGQVLLPQESRASLYYLDKNLSKFFKPDFMDSIRMHNTSNDTQIDFVRYLALLSQYENDGNTNRIARGYKPKMETYYEIFIYSVVGEVPSTIFQSFDRIFPDRDYVPKYENLEQNISALGIPTKYQSIIDLDVYFFGLIYMTVFKGRSIDSAKDTHLHTALNAKIQQFKQDNSHTRAPGALKYLKQRIESSIAIFRSFAI